jgi:hypothetical protein
MLFERRSDARASFAGARRSEKLHRFTGRLAAIGWTSRATMKAAGVR